MSNPDTLAAQLQTAEATIEAMRKAMDFLEDGFRLTLEGGRHHCPWCYARGQDERGEDLPWSQIKHSARHDGVQCPIGAALSTI